MPGPERSTRPSRFTSFIAVLAVPFAAHAEDLMQVYREAQRYDAVYAAARHTVDAGRERLPQGRALLLPTLNLSANAQRIAHRSSIRATPLHRCRASRAPRIRRATR